MQAQPYRADRAREPGQALTAMLKGRSAHGFNPMDIHRGTALQGAQKARKRPQRPARPARPPRPGR